MNDLKQRLNLFSSNPVFGGIIEETKTRIEQLEAKVAALEAELATSRKLKQIWQNRACQAERMLK